MVGRIVALLAGLGAGAAASQAPSFSLQYMHNLTGRIDELRPIVEQFDTAIAGTVYTRESALAECELSAGLLEALCGGYETTVRRYEMLTAHHAELVAAGVYTRPLLIARRAAAEEPFREIAASVGKEFKPALPATADGAAYAGGGFLLLWGGLSFLFGLLGAMTGGGHRRYA